MSAKKSPQDYCVVKIGFTNVMLPVADGLKLMGLIRNAVEVEYDYQGDSGCWLAGERPRCEMVMVSPKDVQAKADTPPRSPRRPRLLGHD
ncbi:hypothetical protein [Stenotrophomonas sp. PS02298]|uniref:hypothetical protein n=1 Tax=Stenotrophomonas sp. PS02298 TaxID=2991424 RepID=UPI00249BDD89|nr:hypothetical protein [Stenotrophomonas sp. PS02298]